MSEGNPEARLREIRERAYRWRFGSDEATVSEAYEAIDRYGEDIPYLLERVAALERENDRLKHIEEHAEAGWQSFRNANREIGRLERENERLRREMNRLSDQTKWIEGQICWE